MNNLNQNASDLKAQLIEALKKLDEIEQSLSSDYFCNLEETLRGSNADWVESLNDVAVAVDTACGIIHRCKDVMKGIGFHVLDWANAPDFAKRCLLLPIGSSPEHEESRMILKFLELWDCYDLKNADLPETRLERFNEIMEKWRQGHDINVERELVSWLQNFDESSLARLAQFIKHSK